MSGGIVIRHASREDLPVLTDLCSQLGYPCSESEILGRLEDLVLSNGHTLLVAVAPGGRVVGWAHGAIRRLLVVPPHLELGGLVVDKLWRGRGIGKKLMDNIESWAVDQGVDTIYVRSNVSRTDAHLFYRRLGYEDIKTSLTFQKKVAA